MQKSERKRQVEQRLLQLDSVRHQRLQILERGDPDSFAAVQWLQTHRNVFQGTVYDPVLVELSVCDSQAARAVESCLNWSTQRTFVCQSRADYDLFTRELIDKRGWRLNVVEMEGMRPLHAYQPPVAKEDIQRMGFDDYALSFVDAPHDVLRFLCQSASLHTIPISFAGRVDPELIESGRSIRRYILKDMLFTVTFSQYGKRLPQTMSRELRPLRTFAESTNLAERQRADDELTRLDNEVKACERAVSDLREENEQHTRARGELQTRRDSLREQLAERRRVIEDWKRAKLSLQSEHAKLARETSQPAVASLRQQLMDLRKEKVLALAALVDQVRDALQSHLAARKGQDVTVLQILRLETELSRTNVLYRAHAEKLNEANATLQTIVDAFAEAKQEALAAKRRAQAQAEQSDEDVRARFSEQVVRVARRSD